MEANHIKERPHSNAITSREDREDIEKEKNNKYAITKRPKTLFSEERFETNAVLLPGQKRKVVQWRMKDRVNMLFSCHRKYVSNSNELFFDQINDFNKLELFVK